MYPQVQTLQAPQPPRRNRRLMLVFAIVGVLVLVGTGGGVLAATGVVNVFGDNRPGADETKETQPAQPDKPSVNPDDTRYQVVKGLCDELDVSGYEALIPAKDELEEEFTENPYGAEANQVECTQYFEDSSGKKLKFATLTVELMAFTSVVEARLTGYPDYASLSFEDLNETEPEWVSGDWEKAQLAEGIGTADGETVVIAQDDNLAMRVTLTTSSVDRKPGTEAVLATAKDVLKMCEK